MAHQLEVADFLLPASLEKQLHTHKDFVTRADNLLLSL